MSLFLSGTLQHNPEPHAACTLCASCLLHTARSMETWHADPYVPAASM